MSKIRNKSTIKDLIIKTQKIEWKKARWYQPQDFKKSSKEQIQKLKTSIIRNGFADAFDVWQKGKIIYILDGCRRDLALKELEKENIKIPDKLSAVFYDIKNNKEAKKLIMLRQSSYGKIDLDTAIDWLDKDINLNKLDLEVDIPDIDLDKPIKIEEDTAPELPKKARSKPGDLYELGPHRIICGDCTDEKVVKKLMNGKKANLLMTSPPYWVGKEYEREKSEKEIDEFIKKSVKNFLIIMNQNYSRIVINSGSTSMAMKVLNEKKCRTILLIDKWINEFKNYNWLLRYFRMWIKGGGQPRPRRPIDDIVYHGVEFIMCFYNSKGKSRGQNRVNEGWVQQDNWSNISGDRQYNNAGYPVEIPSRNIKLYLKENEIVFDPFGGNGTTLIAAHQLNHICYISEIIPLYVDVCVQRYVNFTGIEKIKKNGKVINWKVKK
jgi:DNA modification methylase